MHAPRRASHLCRSLLFILLWGPNHWLILNNVCLGFSGNVRFWVTGLVWDLKITEGFWRFNTKEVSFFNALSLLVVDQVQFKCRSFLPFITWLSCILLVGRGMCACVWMGTSHREKGGAIETSSGGRRTIFFKVYCACVLILNKICFCLKVASVFIDWEHKFIV